MTAAPMPEPCDYSGLDPRWCGHCQGVSTVVTVSEVERIIGRPAVEYRLRPRRIDSRHTRDRWAAPVPQQVVCDDTHRHDNTRGLCRACEGELQRQVGDIPGLVEDLNLAVRRARVFVDHGTRTDTAAGGAPWLGDGVSELGDPAAWQPGRAYSEAAADTIRDLAGVLPRRHREPSKSAVAGSRWLLAHWPDLMRRPDVAEVAGSISAAVVRVHRVIDRPRDLTYLGPCPADGCGWELWVDRGDAVVRCRGCGWQTDRAEFETALLDAAGEQYLTVDELVGRITAAGEVVTRRQILHWIRHDGIPAEVRTVPWWDQDGRIRHRRVDVYLLSAIREQAARAEADRVEAERCAVLERDAYTSAQVADLLGVSLSRLRDLVAQGRVVPIRPGAKPLRFAREGINALTRRPGGGEDA